MRTRTFDLVVALPLLAALAGCSFATRPSVEAHNEADAAFLSSWLHLGADDATQLVVRGAAAAAARRDLLTSDAAENEFGKQALPGAYPPPPAGFEVAFTAILGGASINKFNFLLQKLYLGLVSLQAKFAGGKKPSISILSTTPVAGGLALRTRVVLQGRGPKQAAAAQALVDLLTVNPGPDAPWLDILWPGSSIGEVTSTIGCTDPLCRACPASRQVCTDCDLSVGEPGSDDYATIYRTRSGTCQRCTAPNCDVCSDQGTCQTCAEDYKVDSLGRCDLVCRDQLCLSCPQGSNNCSQCAATSGGYSVYLDTIKQGCKQCTRTNCATCSADGKCSVCKAGFTSDGAGGCRRTCSSSLCTSCPSAANWCTACTEGYQVFGGQCQLACNVPNCKECFSGSTGRWCKVCLDGYKVTSDRLSCVETCEVEGCTRCVPNTGGQVCADCAWPATLSNGACLLCTEPNCEACQPGNNKKCARCTPPFRLNGGGQCRMG